jgi:hypothetical protein
MKKVIFLPQAEQEMNEAAIFYNTSGLHFQSSFSNKRGDADIGPAIEI